MYSYCYDPFCVSLNRRGKSVHPVVYNNFDNAPSIRKPYSTSIDMTLLGGQTITFTTVPTELAMDTIVPTFYYYCMSSSKEPIQNLLSSTSAAYSTPSQYINTSAYYDIAQL